MFFISNSQIRFLVLWYRDGEVGPQITRCTSYRPLHNIKGIAVEWHHCWVLKNVSSFWMVSNLLSLLALGEYFVSGFFFTQQYWDSCTKCGLAFLHKCHNFNTECSLLFGEQDKMQLLFFVKYRYKQVISKIVIQCF